MADWYTYGTVGVYDATPGASSKLLPNLTGGKFVLFKDGPAQSIRDLNGTPISQITSNEFGQSSQFQAQVAGGLVQFGNIVVTVWANEVGGLVQNSAAAVTAAQASVTAAQAAQAAAESAAGQAGVIADGVVTTAKLGGGAVTDAKVASGRSLVGSSAATKAVQDIVGSMVAAAGGTYNAATGVITFPSGGGTADTAAPSVPSGVAASSITSTGFALAWTASTDNVAVTGYDVQVNGTSVATPTSTVATVTGLAAATAYSVRVRARDAAGNWSALSNSVTVTTAAASGGTGYGNSYGTSYGTGSGAADTTAPSIPTDVAASSVTSSGFTLSWTASTDDVGVTGYDVQIGGVSYATPTGTTVAVTGRAASTAYSVRVRAVDAAGNYSALSTAVTVTTTATAPVNLYSTQVPSTPDVNDGQGITLSTRFSSDADGNVTGVRFYRAATAPTTVIGLLYSDAGVELARATFSNLATGWNTVTFATPVAISANTYYRVAYWSSGPYVYSSNLFSSSMVNGHLTGTGSHYAYGSAPAAPTSGSTSGYFADVAFVVTGSVAPPGFASAPGTPNVMASDGSLYVSWAAPSTDGGSPITGYDLQPIVGSSAGAITSVGPTLGAKITGLTNGTAYTVKVRAKNAAGAGSYSAASAAKTPAAPPSGSVSHGFYITTANTGHDNFVDPGLGRKVTDADLTAVPDGTATSDLVAAGGTLSKKWFKGEIIINTPNVTFEACRFDRGITGTKNGVNYPFTLNWCTLAAVTPNAQGIGGVTYNNFTLYRTRVGGEMDGLKANGNVLARECYIRTSASAPDDHNDGVQSTGSDMGNIIERCNIDCRPQSGTGGANAALFVADGSLGQHAWLDNFVAGGDYVIRMYDAATYNVQGNWVLTGSYGAAPVDRRIIPASDVQWGTVRPNLVVTAAGAQVSVVAAP